MIENDDGVFTTSTFARVHYEEDEEIESKVPPTIDRELGDVTSIEGLPMDLTFKVDCKIPFDYIWIKDDEVIINSDDFT